MVAVSSLLVSSWVGLFALGGLVALPLAGSPAEPTPRLSALAPEHCLWYAGSSGTQPAHAESDNPVERLLAEPQVQAFSTEVEAQIVRAVRRAAGSGRESRVLAQELPTLVQAAITHPWGAYVEEVQVRADGAEVEGALVLCAGAEREAIQQSLGRLLELLPPDKRIAEESIGGLRWSVAPTKAHAPRVRWSFTDNGDFILAIGDQTPSRVLERMQGASPAWLDKLRSEHPLSREASVGYLNVAGILQRIRPIVDSEDPTVWPAIEKLGVDQIEALHGRSGLDETGYVSAGHLVTSGERGGLLGMLPYEALAVRDFRGIPHDALLASVCRLDPADVWAQALRLANEFDPDAEEHLERALGEMESEIGVHLEDDVIKSLGDVWTFYVPGGDLMTAWLGSAATVRVADAERLSGALEKMSDALRSRGGERNGAPTIRETKHAGRTIFSLEFSGSPVPVAPSWCVDDEMFVAALIPQTIRTVVDHIADERGGQSLGDVDAVRNAMEGPAAPAALFYQDTPKLVGSIYPLIQMALQMASSQLRQAGIDLDASMLPSADVVIKHLQPSVLTIAHQSDGFHFVSRGTLPGEGNLATAGPIGVALLLPAVGRARQAAERVHDTNRMKQIALAFHLYHDAHGKFPTDVYDEQGAPLLSWRVRLLPYLEDGRLYNQFHLDEPWDSEHNRPLLDQMPDVLLSNDPPTPQGETRFVALRGDETLFPHGEKPMTFSDVGDGTSDTLMFVQATPDFTSPWTKPADVEFDAKKPLAHLGEGREGFLAAFCDGSVRFVSANVAPEIVRALVTADGGEPIDRESLSR